jgi:hypothetical protein
MHQVPPELVFKVILYYSIPPLLLIGAVAVVIWAAMKNKE